MLLTYFRSWRSSFDSASLNVWERSTSATRPTSPRPPSISSSSSGESSLRAWWLPANRSSPNSSFSTSSRSWSPSSLLIKTFHYLRVACIGRDTGLGRWSLVVGRRSLRVSQEPYCRKVTFRETEIIQILSLTASYSNNFANILHILLLDNLSYCLL